MQAGGSNAIVLVAVVAIAANSGSMIMVEKEIAYYAACQGCETAKECERLLFNVAVRASTNLLARNGCLDRIHTPRMLRSG